MPFQKKSAEPFGGDNAPVLLVDDEKAFADALAFRLGARGIPVRVAYRGEEALELLHAPQLELVLLDLNMPGLHGLEALRLIKERRPDVEVVLLTGEADFSIAAKGMRRGAGDYLLKPVDFDALLESITKARQRALRHRERLRAAEAGKLMALGSLAAGVGHEINNPLQIIMQRAEWLQELTEDAVSGQPDFAEISRTASVIQEQARRAGAITAQLLELAHRSRQGKAYTDLSALVASVAKRQKDRADGLGVSITTVLDEDMPLLPWSSAELEPVLSHLLKNSLDAIEARQAKSAQETESREAKGDRIGIAAALHGEEVRITVEDTGEGISPEVVPHIFDPFFSTRSVGSGTGLGLTVCHSIITALRGEIRFVPAPVPPGGALFTIRIPFAREEMP